MPCSCYDDGEIKCFIVIPDTTSGLFASSTIHELGIMGFRALKVTATLCLIVLGASRLYGASLPETYPLGDADDKETNRVDQNLVDWLSQHVDQKSPFEMDPAEFKAFVVKQDAVTSQYLRVARANREAPDTVRAQVDSALKQMAADREASRSWNGHPLLPALYAELLRSGALTPDETTQVLTAFGQSGAGTCADKQMVFDDLSRAHQQSLDDDGLRALLARVSAFRSNNYKKSALRKFLSNLPDGRQVAIADAVLGATEPYPSVVKSSPWLRTYAEKVGKLAAEGPGANLEEARQLAGRRQCSKAKDVLVSAFGTIRKLKAKDTLGDAVIAAKAIDGCYRARSPQLRADLWKNLTEVMTETYGFDGWAEAKLRLGYIHWSGNAFEEAKPLFLEVIGKSENQPSYRKFEARAVFALARIGENENDTDKAALYYQDYVKRFSDQENFDEALMALVLIHVGRQEWDLAMAPLESLIERQDAMPLDARSTGALSFALFWAGRIDLEKGRRKDAAEMWRRVASEYYSTYYGAIGHFMLEQLAGRRLRLQPVRTPTFRMHALRDAFAPAGRLRVRRVEAMMRLGMKSEATCELEELDTSDGKPEKLLVRALMLHAAGEWLEAIKAYDALPRSFRNTLPAGFERILFPVRFNDEIKALALKAEVDPDLVKAIIRQESVFNPRARSPVGALGLMQLMPATANVESKRLGIAYISKDEKRLMRQRVSNPMNLLVAETNLTLGIHHVRTLLEKYKSPVYVLSAYNASPSAAQRWMNTIPNADVLSFIERIPYKETRAYVKLVLRNYFYYKRWYGNPNEELEHLVAVASPLVKMARQTPEPAAAKAAKAELTPASIPTP